MHGNKIKNMKIKNKLADFTPTSNFPSSSVSSLRERGFTLIELLVVIAIIGLLSSVIILGLNAARQKSRDSKRISDIKQLSTALELYYNSNDSYPATYASLATSYLSTLPTYPTPVDSPCISGNSTYAYTRLATSSFQIIFCLGAPAGGVTTAGTHTLTQRGIQ